jgi:molybdate transport system substrate-binding protein
VPPGNPKRVKSLADLADPSVKVVLAAPEVPAGEYSQQILDQAGVTVKPVSLEESVKGVVTKVSLDEADAGIVYVTDVAAAKGKVEGVTIPADQNVSAVYPIATVTASVQHASAQDFVALVLSPAGQTTLKDFGFLSPPGS